MRKIAYFIFVLSIGFHCSSVEKKPPEKSYQVSDSTGEKIVTGKITREQLFIEMPEWRARFLTYTPDSQVVQDLKAIRHDYKIVCVMGVWCSDSFYGVPAFLKALEEAGNVHLKLTLFAVDRKLQDAANTAQKYGVDRVPTFIIYSGDEEIGRMIEIPEDTFEADFVKLIHDHENGTS